MQDWRVPRTRGPTWAPELGDRVIKPVYPMRTCAFDPADSPEIYAGLERTAEELRTGRWLRPQVQVRRRRRIGIADRWMGGSTRAARVLSTCPNTCLKTCLKHMSKHVPENMS